MTLRLPVAVADQARALLRITDELESVSDEMPVIVKDIEVGSSASKENIRRIFGLEGATSLDASAFSSDNVDLEFDTSENGNVKFRATPKGSPSSSFFMRVRANQ